MGSSCSCWSGATSRAAALTTSPATSRRLSTGSATEESRLTSAPGAPSVRRRIIVAAAIGAASLVVAYLFLARPGFRPDFEYPWTAARALLAGRDPYQALPGGQPAPFQAPLLYPLPAILLVVPLAPLPLALAGALFVGLSSALLAFLATRDGWHRLPMFASAPFIMSIGQAQWAPLVTAAALLPALGWLAALKPNLGLAALAYAPSRRALIGAVVVLAASVLLLPAWPLEWWDAVRRDRVMGAHPIPILEAGGFLLLLALIRWRTREARLLLTMACVPQLLFFYDQLPLWLVPRTLRQSLVMTLSSQLGFLGWHVLRPADVHYGIAAIPFVLGSVYLPALVMVLMRTRE